MLWFSHVVFRWRTVGSVFWLLVLATPALLTLRVLWSLLSAREWTDFLWSPWWLGWVVLFLICLTMLQTSIANVCTAKQVVFQTRITMLCLLLRPSHFALILLHTLAAGLMASCLAGILGVGASMLPSEGGWISVNKHFLVIISHGLFMGLWYGVCFFITRRHVLVFPSLQQRKLFRMKGHCFSDIWHAMAFTIKSFRLFLPLYYIFGSWLSHYTAILLYMNKSSLTLTSIWELLDPWLLWLMALSGTFIHMCWTLGLRLFRVYQTQAVQFPVVAAFAAEGPRLLSVALQTPKESLLQHLGFLDLYQLALFSKRRRKQLFSLNSLGRPAVWEDINRVCMDNLHQLVTNLGGRAAAADVNSSVPPVPGALVQEPGYSSIGSGHQSQKGWSDGMSPPPHTLSPPTVSRRQQVYNDRARLWSSYSAGIQDAPPDNTHQSLMPTIMELSSAKQKCLSMLRSIKEKLKKKMCFAYFLGDLPNAVVQKQFADAQLYVWLTSALAQLTAVSYEEDTYGVVQKTLPATIKTLLRVHQLLEKHVRQPFSVDLSYQHDTSYQALETNGRYAVRDSVHSALHLLAQTFHRETRCLQLSSEELHQWRNFLVPKENRS